MLFLEIEDLSAKIEALVFPNVLEQNPFLFQENKILEIKGRVSDKDGTPKIICEKAREIKQNNAKIKNQKSKFIDTCRYLLLQ